MQQWGQKFGIPLSVPIAECWCPSVWQLWKGSDLLKGKGKTPSWSDTGVFDTCFSLSLSLSSVAIQGKRDLSSGVSSPAALPRLHPEGISTRMACWRSRPALWLYTSELTLLEWPRAWTGNQPPHPVLPSKTHGFLKHKSSPARQRTAFEFNPKVQYWTTSAFNEPGWPLWV